MSAFKGKSIKNKSKLRKEVKDIQEFNKRAINQEGSPLQQLLDISKRPLGGEQFNKDLDEAIELFSKL